jgi:3-phosphoshikimate 1-carboxyvinyltransferase
VPTCHRALDGPARFTGGAITIPGDVSSAAYFVAAAMLLPEVTTDDRRSWFESNAGGVSFGAEFVGWRISTTDLQTERNEPFGTINVRGGILRTGDESERTLGGAMIPIFDR